MQLSNTSACLFLFPAFLSINALAGPDAGSLLQQLPAPALPTPTAPTKPKVVQPEATVVNPNSGTRFLVKSLQITGNKKVSTATLQALVADAEGQNLTLEELQAVVSRISDYYQGHGFPLAQAIIPAQTITDGVVQVQVTLARYGNIKLNNLSGVKDELINGPLSILRASPEIEQASLDRALLLISDLPGVSVNSSFSKGEVAGTSDFQVDISASPMAYGQVMLDGYGSSYTGRQRLSSTVVFNDPLKLRNSDTLTVSVLSSGPGMRYGRVSYEAAVSDTGARVGASVSSLQYEVGGSFGSAASEGSAQVRSVWGKQTLIRQRDLNLYGQLQLDALTLSDTTLAGLNSRSLQNLTASFSGDARDAWATDNENFSTWNLGVTSSRVLGSTQGQFYKFNTSLSRLQRLTASDSLYFYGSRQWANRHLDASQQMPVSGPNSVRAYDTGVTTSGDSAYLMNVEYRRELGPLGNGQLIGVIFHDRGNVSINKNESGEKNRFTLAGSGLGLTWAGQDQWSAKTFFATPHGGASVESGATNATRGWLEIGKGF
jgi:hemolysin activation/secretion protein